MASRIPVQPTDPWPGPNVGVKPCCPEMERSTVHILYQTIMTAVAPRDEPRIPVPKAAIRRADKASHWDEGHPENNTSVWQFGAYLTRGVEEPEWGGTYVKQDAYGMPLNFCPWCGAPIELEPFVPFSDGHIANVRAVVDRVKIEEDEATR